MADIEELKALVELAEDSDHELITRLRGALKSKIDGVDSLGFPSWKPKLPSMSARLCLTRLALGIPHS